MSDGIDEIITRAAAFIDAGGLSFGAFARDERGDVAHYASPEASCFDIFGALCRANPNGPWEQTRRAELRIEAHVGMTCLHFVDTVKGQTKDKVVAAMLAARGAE